MEMLEDETARVDIDDIGDTDQPSPPPEEHKPQGQSPDVSEEQWELDLGPTKEEPRSTASFDLDDVEFEFDDNEISDLLEDRRQFEQSK